MLQKKHRGLSQSRIRFINETGETVASKVFRLFVLPSDQTLSRFAVITPAKYFKTAVLRNRIRRSVYRGIERTYEAWTNPKEVVILAKSAICDLSDENVVQELRYIFTRANLI